MAAKEATVDVAAMVDMELKTTTPKAPLGVVQRPVSIPPDDTGRFVFLLLLLCVLNMNCDVGMQYECLN